MSSYFDKVFIDQHIAYRLDKFSWIRDGVAQFRCPICGDSQKNQSKRRGFFYTEDDDIRFKCHNCGEYSGWSLGPWLSKYDVQLAQQYNFDKFKEGKSNDNKFEFKSPPPKQKVIQKTNTLFEDPLQKQTVPEELLCNATRVIDLPVDHSARVYLQGRQMSSQALERLWYTDDFQAFCIGMKSYEASELQKMPNDARIIIPFLSPDGDEVYCYQGRALEKDAMRYITITHKENSPKIYGLDKLDLSRVKLVVEGPFDSLFLPNCVATADSNLMSFDGGDIFIPDNQYRNPEICARIDGMIAAGRKVCLFPKEYEAHKDINDLVKDGGVQGLDLMRLIAQNTFKGLKAKAVWAKLRGV